MDSPVGFIGTRNEGGLLGSFDGGGGGGGGGGIRDILEFNKGKGLEDEIVLKKHDVDEGLFKSEFLLILP
jgi:hypothetical protein